jgi:outer membrane protein OmpA-like peptidoglycan-associated protein
MKTCGTSANIDQASRIGGTIMLNVTPLPWLEAYGAIKTYATTNDQGNPQLLQVLGDTTLGVKGFWPPPQLGQIFTFGGEAQLLLLNGTGGVGLAGNGTSALFRALATADFRKPNDGGIPLRANVNLGYKVDNSGALVSGVEQQRGAAAGLSLPQPITRIERFGLGINEVDFVQLYFGVEAPFMKVQPYIEWSVDIPYNSRNFKCHTSTLQPGDVCLGLANPTELSAGGPGFAAFPSRFSFGAKTNPLPDTFRGLSAHIAFDIATSGSSTFVEEIAPEPPWMFYFGLGFAYDTEKKPVVIAPPPPPQIIEAPQTFVRGLVHDQVRPDAVVSEALVLFEGGVQAPVATGPDGRFLTRHLEPGTYRFAIKAAGFKPGTCAATVAGSPAFVPGSGAPTAAGTFGQSVVPVPGTPPGQPQPLSPPGTPGSVGILPVPPRGPTFVDIDCPLEALPKLGGILGTIHDAESNAPVGGAVVRLSDAGGKELTVTADGTGGFAFHDLAMGTVTLKAEAPGYMSHATPTDVRAGEDARMSLSLTKRPKVAQVKVLGNEIRISKQIHFETDSANIQGDSNALLEEIADVLQHSLGIRKVEIQGHTDNSGTREHNLSLSEARASAVKAWLVAAGVDGNRLTSKGYGQDKPLAPNVTAANKARNRRVQFIILEGH